MNEKLMETMYSKEYAENIKKYEECMNSMNIAHMRCYEFIDFYDHLKHFMKFLKQLALKRGIIVKD